MAVKGCAAMKRRRALAGIFTLTLSSFALRGAGLLFRLALTDRLGAEGMGIYQLISTVDLFCSLLTCAGIPLTVSRLCAERRSQARSVVQQACFYGAAMGLLPAMALFLFSDSLAFHLLGDIRTAAALRWIAPSLPLLGISAALRGVFLSRGKVLVSTLTEAVDQAVRIGLGLLLLGRCEGDLSMQCAAVFFASSAAELISLLALTGAYLRCREPPGEPAPHSLLMGGLLPIWLGALLSGGVHSLENLLLPALLRQAGASAAQALAQYGLLSGLVMPLLMFPAALPAAIGTLMLPRLAQANAQDEKHRVRTLVEQALTASLWIGLLCCGGFLLLGPGVLRFYYHEPAAVGLLMLLSPLLPLHSLDHISDVLLKALGKQRVALGIEFADSLLRIGGILLLVPRAGMRGVLLTLYLSAVLCVLGRLHPLMRAAGLQRGILLRALCLPFLLCPQWLRKKRLSC